jgi:hypothetical protein
MHIAPDLRLPTGWLSWRYNAKSDSAYWFADAVRRTVRCARRRAGEIEVVVSGDSNARARHDQSANIFVYQAAAAPYPVHSEHSELPKPFRIVQQKGGSPNHDHVPAYALARLAHEEVDHRIAHPNAYDAHGDAAHTAREREERTLARESERRRGRIEERCESSCARGRAYNDLETSSHVNPRTKVGQGDARCGSRARPAVCRDGTSVRPPCAGSLRIASRHRVLIRVLREARLTGIGEHVTHRASSVSATLNVEGERAAGPRYEPDVGTLAGRAGPDGRVIEPCWLFQGALPFPLSFAPAACRIGTHSALEISISSLQKA